MQLHFWQVGVVAIVGVLLGCSRPAGNTRSPVATTPVVSDPGEPTDTAIPVSHSPTAITPSDDGPSLPMPGRDGGPDLPALAGRPAFQPPVPPRPPAAFRPALPLAASSTSSPSPATSPAASPLTSARRAED